MRVSPLNIYCEIAPSYRHMYLLRVVTQWRLPIEGIPMRVEERVWKNASTLGEKQKAEEKNSWPTPRLYKRCEVTRILIATTTSSTLLTFTRQPSPLPFRITCTLGWLVCQESRIHSYSNKENFQAIKQFQLQRRPVKGGFQLQWTLWPPEGSTWCS